LHIPITDDRALSLAADLVEAVRRRHAPSLAAMPDGMHRRRGRRPGATNL
jgi:hypothetical protein